MKCTKDGERACSSARGGGWEDVGVGRDGESLRSSVRFDRQPLVNRLVRHWYLALSSPSVIHHLRLSRFVTSQSAALLLERSLPLAPRSRSFTFCLQLLSSLPRLASHRAHRSPVTSRLDRGSPRYRCFLIRSNTLLSCSTSELDLHLSLLLSRFALALFPSAPTQSASESTFPQN
jgi:hypothetical protein